MRRRVILRRFFVAVLLLLLVDTVIWAVLCQRLEQGIRDATAAAHQQGWAVAAEALHWRGWPLAAAIDLDNVAAAGTILPGLVWQTERAQVGLAFLRPTTLAVRIGGRQSIAADGVVPIPFTASHALIEADLTGTAPPHASIAALSATLPTGTLTLDQAELSFPLNAVTADLAGLALPGAAAPIGAAHLRAAIDPALPLAATPEDGARAWRQAGGHLDIAEAAVHWDTLDATGSGTITLDERLQPHADGTIQATGLPRLLDDLARSGTLAPAQAGAAKAVVAVLAAPSGGQRVQLPISLADGVLRLARFPLLRLPPLAWD